jgi:glycosyltransferase involved in cell wall biosynthesis
VFVLCSDSEGVPTVLLEALALGRKIVVTAVGGIPEVIALFPGYPVETVPPGDAALLAGALERSLAARREVPAAAADTLERYFSPTVAAAAHAALYRELVRAD